MTVARQDQGLPKKEGESLADIQEGVYREDLQIDMEELDFDKIKI